MATIKYKWVKNSKLYKIRTNHFKKKVSVQTSKEQDHVTEIPHKTKQNHVMRTQDLQIEQKSVQGNTFSTQDQLDIQQIRYQVQ